MNDSLERFERLAQRARCELPPPLDVSNLVTEQLASSQPHVTRKENISPHRNSHRLSATVSICSMVTLLLLMGFFWLSETEATAEAALAKALIASEELTDRVYKIVVERKPRWPFRERIDATLTLRGGNQFVLDYPQLLRGRGILGTDGEVAWLVPEVGPVIVNSDPRILKKWLAERDVSLPFLSLPAILQRMTDRYEVTRLSSISLDSGDNTEFIRLRGLRLDNKKPGPHEVELWIEPETHLAHRVVLRWNEPNNPTPLRVISLQLVAEEEKPTDWYDHQSHHESDRPVITLPKQLSESKQ